MLHRIMENTTKDGSNVQPLAKINIAVAVCTDEVHAEPTQAAHTSKETPWRLKPKLGNSKAKMPEGNKKSNSSKHTRRRKGKRGPGHYSRGSASRAP